MTSINYKILFSRLMYVGENGLRVAVSSTIVPNRSTYMLKRRFPVALVKFGEEDHYRKLKAKNYIYDMVEDTDTKKQKLIKVVLKTFVEGLGQKGDVVEVKRNYGYHKLLLPGLADYASEEAIKNAEIINANKDTKQFSSKSAPMVVKFLEKMVVSVVMNMETPWTLEPWHVKTALRKAGVFVPEEALRIPQQAITGPDLNLENKEFLVFVTINKKEQARLRCRIHHWSTNIQDRLPFIERPWFQKADAIFKEEATLLEQLPLSPDPKKSSISEPNT